MAKPVIILGTGGHARVLADSLRLLSVTIVGMVSPARPDGLPDDVPYLGDDEAVLAHPVSSVDLINGLGSVGDAAVRRGLFEVFKARGYTFATVVHPGATVAGDCELGEGVQVMAGAIIQTCSVIGANTIINTRAVVDHDARIGASCHIAPGAVLSGQVTLGDGAHVGTGAAIMQGVTIGDGAVVGVGAAIVRDVPAGARYGGVPARELSRRT